MDTSGNATAITNATYATQVQQWTSGTYNGGETVIQAGGWGATDFNTMHVPQQMAQNAVDFMADNVAHHGADPFFMYYSTVGVHTPHVPDLQLEVDLNGDGDTLDAGEVTAIDGYDGTGLAPDDQGTNRMGMVSTIDAELGVLRAYLEATDDPRNPGHKLIDNTMLIFTSDNGARGWGVGEPETDDWTIYGHDGSSGLRDRKGSIYEGGHRVPFIVKWEGSVEEGAVRDQLIGTHDLMATLAGLTDQSLTDQAKDSYNMLPVLLGDQDDSDPVRDHMIVEHISGQGQPRGNAYYEGRWKLMVDRSNTTSPTILGFFDLAADPAEATDLTASTDPGVVARRDAMYANYVEHRNAARSAPVFIASGDATTTDVLSAYTHVITEGAVSGNGTVRGDLQANAGAVIEVTDSGSTATQLSINPTQDLRLVEDDQHYNSNARLAMGRNGSGFLQRSVLEFDLAGLGLEEGATVTGARMVMTIGFAWGTAVSDTPTIEVYPLTTGFDETTATWTQPWSTPGGDYDALALLSEVTGFDPDTVDSGDELVVEDAAFLADISANLDLGAYRLLMKYDDASEVSGLINAIWVNSNQKGDPPVRLELDVTTPANRTMGVQGDLVARAGSVVDLEIGDGGHDVLAVTGRRR